MKKETPIYTITFKRNLGMQNDKHQDAYGKKDLFDCIRGMLKDGFTDIHIKEKPKNRDFEKDKRN